MAERTTYRAGTGNYAELNDALAAVQADLAAKEEGEKGKGEDGRGDAILDGAPKPMPGDELYDTLFQTRAERTNEEGLAARQAGEPNLAALLAAYAITNGQGQQQPASENVFDRFVANGAQADQAAGIDGGRVSFQAMRGEQAASATASFPEAARAEVEQPGQDHQGRASVEAMDMEGPGPTRPGQSDNVFDNFVTDETRADKAAEWKQDQENTNKNAMALTL